MSAGEVASKCFASNSFEFLSSNIVLGRANAAEEVLIVIVRDVRGIVADVGVCVTDCARPWGGIGVEARTAMSACSVDGVGCSTVVKTLGPFSFPSFSSSFFSVSGGLGAGKGTIGDGHIHSL